MAMGLSPQYTEYGTDSRIATANINVYFIFIQLNLRQTLLFKCFQ